ncbi:MAG: type III-B CRISPR module RAMP protein Cmr6 [Thermoplasmata archaeon]
MDKNKKPQKVMKQDHKKMVQDNKKEDAGKRKGSSKSDEKENIELKPPRDGLPARDKGIQNLSLMYDKWRQAYDIVEENKEDETKENEKKKEQYDRKEMLKVAGTIFVGDYLNLYRKSFEKHECMLSEIGAETACFSVNGRLAVGLGGENVWEVGLALSRIYGTPIIPGSALKGLAAHYCDKVWGSKDKNFRKGGEYYEFMFGDTEEAGHLEFHDGWITPDTLSKCIKKDIMTPHHVEYYSDGKKPPTDFDSPNPVSFLSVQGDFLIPITCQGDGEERKKWQELGMKLLEDALSQWGVGGKTNIGYGRMYRKKIITAEEEWFEKTLEEIASRRNKKKENVLKESPNEVKEKWDAISDTQLKQKAGRLIYEKIKNWDFGICKRIKKELEEYLKKSGNLD